MRSLLPQLLALYPNSLMVRVGRLRESLRIAETVLGMQYSDHVVRTRRRRSCTPSASPCDWIGRSDSGARFESHCVVSMPQTPSLLRMGPLRLQARVDDVLARLGGEWSPKRIVCHAEAAWFIACGIDFVRVSLALDCHTPVSTQPRRA